MYDVRSLLPLLDERGAQGWELVQMLPINVGDNGDISYASRAAGTWMYTYLCVFKRPKREP